MNTFSQEDVTFRSKYSCLLWIKLFMHTGFSATTCAGGKEQGREVSATIPAVAHLAAWGRAAPERAPENVPGCSFVHGNKEDVVRTAPCFSFA